jgi:hypothetical protein
MPSSTNTFRAVARDLIERAVNALAAYLNRSTASGELNSTVGQALGLRRPLRPPERSPKGKK